MDGTNLDAAIDRARDVSRGEASILPRWATELVLAELDRLRVEVDRPRCTGVLFCSTDLVAVGSLVTAERDMYDMED